MADSVFSSTEFSGSYKGCWTFSNNSDGTGETLVNKIATSDLTNLSGLNTSDDVNGFAIAQIWWNVRNWAVNILAGSSSDANQLLSLTGDGHYDFRNTGGLQWGTSSTTDANGIFFTTAHGTTVANTGEYGNYTIRIAANWDDDQATTV